MVSSWQPEAMLMTRWCRLMLVSRQGDWVGEIVGIVDKCGVGVVVVGGDGREWGSDMGPGRGGSSIETTPGQQLGPQVTELGFRNTAAVDWKLCKGEVWACSGVAVKSDWPYLAMRLVGGVCGVGRSRTCSTT